MDLDELWESWRLPRRPTLPGRITLLGQAGKAHLPLELDGDGRLAVQVASPMWTAGLPQGIGTAATELAAAGEVVITSIEVVNTTAAAVSLALYFQEGLPLSGAAAFGMAGGGVPGNGRWGWRGRLASGGVKSLYAVAGAAGALVATVGLQAARGRLR
jgi:hypothetical protein